MSYDISDIKKLLVEDRLEIIDEKWETCVAESPDTVYEDESYPQSNGESWKPTHKSYQRIA